MTRIVDRDEVQRLQRAGAQLVEVLPQEEFEREHLPGAISMPLEEIDLEEVAALDGSAGLVVYCYDSL